MNGRIDLFHRTFVVCYGPSAYPALPEIQLSELTGIVVMAVPPEFIEDLRHRIPLSEIIGRRVKLVRKGRRYSGLCPFHSEKTPSFSVVDDDGFYHCFGCGAHGDAISFLREMDGLDFTEAVQRLADMAGLTIPSSRHIDPSAVKKRNSLLSILEETTLFFEAALNGSVGNDALEYFKGRGLTETIVRKFRLGYAPRSGLYESLVKKGYSDADLMMAGVVRKSERDSSVYDYFRDRVIFPIENRQGKVIAFGARALGDAQPKYLNSGDGPTFSKKAMLYGWVQARDAARRKLPLVVVEGYMDVIAIHRSGVAGAVAPLGTALTSEQISLLWKLHDEPIICFDGDAAGQRAQLRALERILPILEPGRSARFARLPEGKDPDDVLGADGPEGLQKILATAHSLVDSIWITTAEQFDLKQPEARAQFWQSIRSLVRSIGNNHVRGAYGDEVENRIVAMRSHTRGQTASFPGRHTARPQTGLINRYRAVIALIMAHPNLVTANFEALSMIEMADQRLEQLKKAVIDAVIRDPDLDVAALNYHLQSLDFTGVVEELSGDEMKSRLPFDPHALAPDRAAAHLEELLGLVEGKSGLFSKVRLST